MSPFSKVNVRRDDSSVSEFEAPLRLRSGATTGPRQTPLRPSPVCIPGAWIPSSLLSNIRIVTRCIDKLPDHAGGEAARRQPETQFNGYVIPPVPAELLWIESIARRAASTFSRTSSACNAVSSAIAACSKAGASRWLQSPLPGSVAVIISSRLCTRACETSSSSGVTTNQLPRPANCSASPSTT